MGKRVTKREVIQAAGELVKVRQRNGQLHALDLPSAHEGAILLAAERLVYEGLLLRAEEHYAWVFTHWDGQDDIGMDRDRDSRAE